MRVRPQGRVSDYIHHHKCQWIVVGLSPPPRPSTLPSYTRPEDHTQATTLHPHNNRTHLAGHHGVDVLLLILGDVDEHVVEAPDHGAPGRAPPRVRVQRVKQVEVGAAVVLHGAEGRGQALEQRLVGLCKLRVGVDRVRLDELAEVVRQLGGCWGGVGGEEGALVGGMMVCGMLRDRGRPRVATWCVEGATGSCGTQAHTTHSNTPYHPYLG